MAPRDVPEYENDEYLLATPLETKTIEWNATDHIIWFNVFWFIVLHIVAAYGLLLAIFDAQWKTNIFALFIWQASLFGITAGVHRLWSHRAYKAKLPLRIFLAILNSMAYQNSIFVWARDHRVHHKYTETDADPVNSKRGLFFSHCGWLMCKKHPDVRRIGGRINLDDVINDPVVFYQHKYYMPSVLLMCIIVPTLVPWYFWSETLWNAFFVCVICRYIIALNAAWSVNSFAHMFGYRPYDKDIAPVENEIVSALTVGEGFHNFHHTFPWDYKTGEFSYFVNITTILIDFFALLGLAYERKSASAEMIRNRKERTGKVH